MIGFYTTVETSTLQMNVSGDEEKIETNVVSRAQLWGRVGARSKHRALSVGKVRKAKVEGCFDHGRGTHGVFGDACVVVFEAESVGNPRIFGAGLGGEARGSTDG